MAVPLIREYLQNMHEAELFLKEADEAKDVQWTTVLPGGLKNGSVTSENERKSSCWSNTVLLTDKEIHHLEGEYILKGKSERINRADVARFILDVAEGDRHVGRKRRHRRQVIGGEQLRIAGEMVEFVVMMSIRKLSIS